MTSGPASALLCPRCGRELPQEAFSGEGASCPTCETHVEGAILSALFRTDEIARYEPVVSGEAACFFHAGRVAVFACSRCGRFLCPACRIPWPGGDVCQACLEAARKAQPGRAFPSSRFHFDSLALVLSTLPVLAWFFTLITAPIALGFAIFTFRRECSIVPRTKIRFILAIFFSLATIAAWVLLWGYYLIPGSHRGSTNRIG